MIRNIVFDYGGVLIDLDEEAPIRLLEQMQVPSARQVLGAKPQPALIDLFEMGKITEREFRDGLRTLLQCMLSDAQIDQAWNAMILGIRSEKLTVLRKLYTENYRMFLLSNTNFIHLKYITKYLVTHFDMVNLDRFFEKIYYSCVVGLRKPDPALFQLVLQENLLKPHETLYIDDQEAHVAAARQLGIVAQRFDSTMQLESVLNAYLR